MEGGRGKEVLVRGGGELVVVFVWDFTIVNIDYGANYST